MSRIQSGLLAGLAATAVLSALMVMKAMAGVMPELNVVAMLATMLGTPEMPAVGWAVHLTIGIVGYGLAMAAIGGHAQGGAAIGRGLTLAAIGWLVMMIVLMPMAGQDVFGIVLGPMAPMATLVLHAVFGLVLGWTYGRLVAPATYTASTAPGSSSTARHPGVRADDRFSSAHHRH